MNGLILTNVCYGTINPTCPLYCEGALIILENIITAIKDYDIVFVVNDSHYDYHSELKYLPPHMLYQTEDCENLEWEKQFKNKILNLKKHHLSALSSRHNQELIQGYRFKKLTIGGFCGHLDVLATCIDIIKTGIGFGVDPELVGDVSDEKKQWGLDYFKWLNL